MASKDLETRRRSARAAALSRWGREREAHVLRVSMRAAAANRRAAEAAAEAERAERELAELDGGAA